MPSFVWDRDAEEAWAEPYEYEGQKQFVREAERLLPLLKEHYSKGNMHYHGFEESLEKAVWLLQVDSLEAIIDAFSLTNGKKHRMATRLFRDAVETMDISAYFFLAGEKGEGDLARWYRNEVIPHRRFRDFIRKHQGDEEAENLRGLYGDLSKYTHRTHNSILKSYLLGQGDKLAYDGFREGDTLVLPHVVSFSYAIIAALIKRFIVVAQSTESMSADHTKRIWEESLEEECVPRRFGRGPGQIMRGPPIEIKTE